MNNIYVVLDNCCRHCDHDPDVAAVFSTKEKCKEIVAALNSSDKFKAQTSGHFAQMVVLKIDEISSKYEKFLK